MHAEQTKALNQLTTLIDTRANDYKQQYMRMPQANRVAQKKLILDLIDDAIQLALTLRPVPNEIINDFKALAAQLNRLK